MPEAKHVYILVKLNTYLTETEINMSEHGFVTKEWDFRYIVSR